MGHFLVLSGSLAQGVVRGVVLGVALGLLEARRVASLASRLLRCLF